MIGSVFMPPSIGACSLGSIMIFETSSAALTSVSNALASYIRHARGRKSSLDPNIASMQFFLIPGSIPMWRVGCTVDRESKEVYRVWVDARQASINQQKQHETQIIRIVARVCMPRICMDFYCTNPRHGLV